MADSKGKRPFWAHQLVEYILGGALVAAGLQSPTPVVPAVVGGVIMAHAAVTRGPLGAFRVISRGLHRVLDLPIIAFEIVAAVQPWVSVDAGSRVVVGGIAAAHLFVWWQSNFAERRKRNSIAAEGGRSTEVGRIAGRLVGNGVNAVRRQRGDKST
jgi:hypothetical protein